jgi:hypothetical protein
VRLLDPHTETDPAALLFNFLVATGVLFGRHAYCMADGATHYPTEYLVNIGQTGQGRKGTATKRFMNVINLVEEDSSTHHVLGGFSSGEGLVKGIQDKNQVRM